jgi:hypothetical protein
VSRKRMLAGALAVAASATGVLGGSIGLLSSAAAHASMPSQESSNTLTTSLRAMPAGTVKLSRSRGHLVVGLSVWGLTPGSSHSIDVLPGTCPQSFRLGGNLENVTANAVGQVNKTFTTVQGDFPSRPRKAEALTVRLGVAAKVNDGGVPIQAAQAVGCVNLPRQLSSVPQTVRLLSHEPSVTTSTRPSSGTGQSGIWTTASLTARATFTDASDGQVTVHIQAAGLAPSSIHAAHIHQGSCKTQGPVVQMLSDLTADSNGNVDATRTFRAPNGIPSTGWYLNLHLGASNGPTGILDDEMDPTIYFQPLLCANIPGPMS